MRTLGLPPDGEVAAQLRKEFEEEEVDGADLVNRMRGTGKRLLNLLSGLLEADPEAACRALMEARGEADVTISSPVPPVQEAQTPLSMRWAPLLERAGADRRDALQAVVDRWRSGRWTIEEKELGRGSSGAVFRSSDTRLGQMVAIKFSHSDEPRKLEREAQLMQRVAHEHICRLHEYHLEQGGLCWMVMELLSAGSLHEAIHTSPDKRLREFEVAKLGFHILSALVWMHKTDVIHRDIKPSNIMLTNVDGQLLYKLIDLSIAAVDRDARSGVSGTLATGTTGLAAVLGTLHYMSPEQFTVGKVVTTQTDLWSLGVVMFEALSGVLPFAHCEMDDLKINHAVRDSTPAKPLEELVEEVGSISEGMCAYIARALQKDPTQRFTTAVEMETALDDAIRTSGDERFGLFISYRVWCDHDFAEALYTAASKLQLRPGREHCMKVYLDKVRIVDGQRFDVNFAKGLANSTVFSPLVSANCLKNFVELGQTDKEDFVLAEWIMALELQKQGIVKAIFPIVMGEQRNDGKYSQTFFEDLRDSRVSWPASHPGASFAYPAGSGTIPDVISAKSIAKAREFLGMLDPPVTLSQEMTVNAVVKNVLTFQAILLHFENDNIDSLDGMQLVRVNSTHGERAKEIARKHMAQACAERIVKVVSELEKEITTRGRGHASTIFILCSTSEKDQHGREIMKELEKMCDTDPQLFMGYDWAGSSNVDLDDLPDARRSRGLQPIDWGDSESVKTSSWFAGYKFGIKGKVMMCAQIAGTKRVVLIAIEGGPISKLEARELPILKEQVQFDLATKGIAVQLDIQNIDYDAFLQEYASSASRSDHDDGVRAEPEPEPELAPEPEPEPEQASVTALQLVNDLQHISLQDVGLMHQGANIGWPQICVVGGQAEGKSTLLNAIVSAKMSARMNFLPEGSGMVTRCPIMVQMTCPQGEMDHTATVRTQRRSSDELEEGDPDVGGRIVGPGADPTPEELADWGFRIQQRITALQDHIVGPGQVTHQKIIVRLVGPTLPNLSLVDLPGLRAADNEKAKGLKEKLKIMVRDNLTSPNAIILCVGQAGTDPANWVGHGLAKEVDVGEERTIGVVTKADTLFGIPDTQLQSDNQRQIKDVLDDAGDTPFYAAYNPQPQDEAAYAKAGIDLKVKLEETFRKGRVGNTAIAQDLEQKLSEHLQDQLPTLYEKFKEKLAALDEELSTKAKPSWLVVEQLMLTYGRIAQVYLTSVGDPDEVQAGFGLFDRDESGERIWDSDETFQEELFKLVSSFAERVSPTAIYNDHGALGSVLHKPTAEVLQEVARQKKPSVALVHKMGPKWAELSTSQNSDDIVAVAMGTQLSKQLHGLCGDVLGDINKSLIPLCKDFYEAVSKVTFKLDV